MELQQIIEELTSLRNAAGYHMLALDNMTPVERKNAFLCDLKRMRQISQELGKLAH